MTRAQEGFTLVELLAAIVLFSVGTLTLVSVLPLGTNRVTRAASQTRASQHASACAERLLTTPYEDAALTAGLHEDPENPHDAIYHLRWIVEEDQPASGCKRLTVEVRWPTADAAPGASLLAVIPRSGG